jgi:hypothetical protein
VRTPLDDLSGPHRPGHGLFGLGNVWPDDVVCNWGSDGRGGKEENGNEGGEFHNDETELSELRVGMGGRDVSGLRVKEKERQQ